MHKVYLKRCSYLWVYDHTTSPELNSTQTRLKPAPSCMHAYLSPCALEVCARHGAAGLNPSIERNAPKNTRQYASECSFSTHSTELWCAS